MSRKTAAERLEGGKKSNYIPVIFIILILLVITFGIYSFFQGRDDGSDRIYTSTDTTGDTITISRESIDDGKIHHFSSSVEGVTVKYFVMIKDDKVHSAFDACDVCYRAKKGYIQEGDYAKCLNCGQKFAISELGSRNRNGGGCWPGHLPHNVDGNNILIEISDLRKGMYYFE